MNGELREIVAEHGRKYPRMEPTDAVKLVYQHVLGGGHLVKEEAGSLARLRAELAAVPQDGRPLGEPLGNGLARMHLQGLEAAGLSPETANRLFFLSAQTPMGSREQLLAGLETLRAVCAAGTLPFSPEALEAYLAAYAAQDYPPVSHSPAYRAAYAPAYRVIRAEYLALLPVLAAVDRVLARKGQARVAIDGRAAAGKTTLAALLAPVYGANLFHMDDFFLRDEQRTPERLAEPGGNVDRERFAAEVLAGLDSGEPFCYRPFDCSVRRLAAPVPVEPRPVTVVEGSYSLHPALREGHDVRVFVDISPEEQARRILLRNGPAMQRRFLEEWIPLEERYFDTFAIREEAKILL